MKIKAIIKQFDFLAFVGAIVLLAGIKPYYLWNAPSVIDVGIKILAIIIFAFTANVLKGRNSILFILFFLFLFLFGLIRGVGLIDWLFTIIPISCLPFVKERFGNNCYKYFIYIYSTLMAVSLIVWTAVLLGSSLPAQIIEPLNSIKEYNYLGYPFLLVPLKENIMQSIRFASVFDEPGVVGTISLICLYINGFNMRKWYNIVILISGICSFSLMFYLGTLLYTGALLFKTNKLAVFFSIIFVVAFYFATKDNEVFEELIYSRVEWNQNEGSFSGDNRSRNGEKEYLEQIRGSSDYWWGSSPSVYKRFEGSWGYRNVIIMYGMVFFMLYCMFFYVFAFNRKLSFKSICLFSIIFISVIYQRPDLFETTKVFLMSQYILVLSQADIKRKSSVLNNNHRKQIVYAE